MDPDRRIVIYQNHSYDGTARICSNPPATALPSYEEADADRRYDLSTSGRRYWQDSITGDSVFPGSSFPASEVDSTDSELSRSRTRDEEVERTCCCKRSSNSRSSARHARSGWSASFSDKHIHAAFIRKVYLILLAQLLITIGFICLVIYTKPVKKWVKSNLWFYLVSYGIFLVLFFVLFCVEKIRRTFPGNFICLLAFTLSFSCMAATISAYHSTSIVLIMMCITAIVVLSITLFACQTMVKFTMCRGILFGVFIVLLVFGILFILIKFTSVGHIFIGDYIANLVTGGVAALIFTLVLVIDTHLIIKGSRVGDVSEEEYIFAALNLYLDIVFIFLLLLGGGGDS